MVKNWKNEAEYWEKSSDDWRGIADDRVSKGAICMAIFVTAYICICFTAIITSEIMNNGIDVSQETGDDICRQLTGNKSAIAEDYRSDREIGKGNLACTLPSFDSTQNIIVRQNNGE